MDGQQKRINHEYLKNHFLHEGRLKEQQALYIIEHVANVLSREPNMVNVKSPVTSVFLFPPSLYWSSLNLSSMRRHSWTIREI